MAVADVYDALISRRRYKPAIPHEQAVAMIMEGKGKLFDPELADVFLGCPCSSNRSSSIFPTRTKQFIGPGHGDHLRTMGVPSPHQSLVE